MGNAQCRGMMTRRDGDAATGRQLSDSPPRPLTPSPRLRVSRSALGFRLSAFRFCSLLALTFIAGCSGSDVPLAEVTGEVTFNGLPTAAEIVFEPGGEDAGSGGRPSSAFAGRDGSFRLFFTEDRAGAVIGRHRVLVKILRSTGDEEPRSFEQAVTPIKTARLVRHVREGRNHFRFAVTY